MLHLRLRHLKIAGPKVKRPGPARARAAADALSRRLDHLVPTLAFFVRCWRYLHRTASRRTVEYGMTLVLLTQIARLAEALGYIPMRPLIGNPSQAARLVLASNGFYGTLWPSPAFWCAALVVALLCALAGLHQVVATVMLTHVRGDPRLLSDRGEDDERYFTSVNPAWLLADVGLRRLAMALTMGFLLTASWVLFVHTGWPSLLYVGLLMICGWVDNRLRETAGKHWERLRQRRQAERDATRAAFGEGRVAGGTASG